jgi:hypothetical protein
LNIFIPFFRQYSFSPWFFVNTGKMDGIEDGTPLSARDEEEQQTSTTWDNMLFPSPLLANIHVQSRNEGPTRGDEEIS